MIRKYRLIMYGSLITAAIFFQVVRPNEPLWEPLSFIGLVIVLGTVVEINSYKKGIK